MKQLIPRNKCSLVVVLLLLGLPATRTFAADKAPEVGEKAPDFALKNLDGKTVELKALLVKGPVALIVLRGYPGYQCPFCTRQVAELIQQAKDFVAAGAQVVLVYPGPTDQLGERAREFIAGRSLPDNFHFVIDPGYTFTNAYALRWNASSETAYPSSFVINGEGKVTFAKLSKRHGDRATTTELLSALKKK